MSIIIIGSLKIKEKEGSRMQQQKQQQKQQQQQQTRPLVVAVLTAPGQFSYREELNVDVEVRNMSKSFSRIRHDRGAWKRKLRAVLQELKSEPVPDKIIICVYPNWLDSTLVVILEEFGTRSPVEVWVSRLSEEGPIFEPPSPTDSVFS
jgi:hypothetical protein